MQHSWVVSRVVHVLIPFVYEEQLMTKWRHCHVHCTCVHASAHLKYLNSGCLSNASGLRISVSWVRFCSTSTSSYELTCENCTWFCVEMRSDSHLHSFHAKFLNARVKRIASLQRLPSWSLKTDFAKKWSVMAREAELYTASNRASELFLFEEDGLQFQLILQKEIFSEEDGVTVVKTCCSAISGALCMVCVACLDVGWSVVLLVCRHSSRVKFVEPTVRLIWQHMFMASAGMEQKIW